MSNVQTVSDASEFDAALGGNTMVITKFQTRNCVICRRMDPGLKAMAERLTDRLRIIELDAEDHAGLARRFGIQGVPTLILFKNGKEVSRRSGFQSGGMLNEWVAPHL